MNKENFLEEELFKENNDFSKKEYDIREDTIKLNNLISDLRLTFEDFDFFSVNEDLIYKIFKYTQKKNGLYVVYGQIGVGKYSSICLIAAKLIFLGMYSNSQNLTKSYKHAPYSIAKEEIDILSKLTTHPDVFIVNANSELTVELAADIKRFLSTTGLLSKNKVIVINNADRLNRFSSNALLKELEELSNNIYVFFITTNSYLLFDTILSRSILVRTYLPKMSKECSIILPGQLEYEYKNILRDFFQKYPSRHNYLIKNELALKFFIKLYDICLKKNQNISSILEDLSSIDIDIRLIEEFFIYLLFLSYKSEDIFDIYQKKQDILESFKVINTSKIEKKSVITSLILKVFQ